MKKTYLFINLELSLGIGKNCKINHVVPKDFLGTSCPRKLRIISALISGSQTRERLDRIAGASNTPQLIMELRRLGLKLPCVLERVYDRDGKKVRRGRYSFETDDRVKVLAFLKERGKA